MANKINDNTLRGIHFRMLTDAQCQRIYDLACELLATEGWTLGHDDKGRAKKYYAEAGCTVEGENVKIPTRIIEEALASAPSEFYIYDQLGNPAMHMSAKEPKSYIFTAANPLHIFDIETGERRDSYVSDATKHAIIQQALPNINIPCGMTWPVDCPECLTGTYETREMLRGLTKPLALFAHEQKDFAEMIRLCYAVAGGKEKFIEKPFGTHIGTLGTVDFTIDVIESGAILVAQSCLLVGAKAPVTMAGMLVQGLAENLATLVLTQQIRKGYPYIGSIYGDTLDFRSLGYAQTAPEMGIHAAASADLFHYLGLPCNCHLGATDSPVFDQQAAHDITFQIMSAFLSGVNISGFSGLLESAMAGSILNIIYVDEICSYMNTFINGIDVNFDTMAGDVFREIGFGGDFLNEMHTVRYMRDQWTPELFIRQSYDQWQAAGGKNFEERAREKAKAILAKGIQNPKDDALSAELDALVKDSTERMA